MDEKELMEKIEGAVEKGLESVNDKLDRIIVALMATQTSGGALSLTASDNYNHVSIFRIH